MMNKVSRKQIAPLHSKTSSDSMANWSLAMKLVASVLSPLCFCASRSYSVPATRPENISDPAGLETQRTLYRIPKFLSPKSSDAVAGVTDQCDP
jgi:hypothetical protein